MLKLKRYLKPYVLFLVCGIALLFGQAMLELEPPNYMSNIVNIGIQQGGITQIAPEAISFDGMQLAQTFMSESDRAAVAEAYDVVADPLPLRDKFVAQTPDAFIPAAQLVCMTAFIQTPQPAKMRNRCKGLRDMLCADAVYGGVGQYDARLLLKCAQAVKQRVVFGVADNGRVLFIVAAAMFVKLVDQRLHFLQLFRLWCLRHL